MSKKHQIAIVGVGPRGLAALENIYLVQQNLGIHKLVRVLLFETSSFPGAGQIWTPQQVHTNLSNVHERNLSENLDGRPVIDLEGIYIPAFKGYGDWLAENTTETEADSKDVFPPRAKLGAYLHARFESIKNALLSENLLVIYQKAIVYTKTSAEGCTVTDDTGKDYEVDELVLTIGHQPTRLSQQMFSWENHVKLHPELKLYEDPYPVGALETDLITPETTVALRGFGLSMVDQMRALSIGFGGEFNTVPNSIKFKYIPSGREPKKLIAFSLDGLPPAPKPVNAAVDAWFKPTEEDFERFRESLNAAVKQPEHIADASFLVRGVAEMTASVFKRMGTKARQHKLSLDELFRLSENLIRQPDATHELILSQELSSYQQMEVVLNMAFGKRKISLDYCLGQVWRYALGVLYHDYTYLNLSDTAMTDVVKYIEASKRYSYGPPVASLQQLIALVDAEILDLDFVNDPQIDLVDQGWEFDKNGKKSVATVMVNSVIDPPQLLKVKSPLIEALLADRKAEPVDYKLGLHTLEDGRIISKAGNDNQHIALLGRLAKGSVIGVDDLIECFGKPARLWAEGVLKRL